MPKTKDAEGAYWIRGIGEIPINPNEKSPNNKSNTAERISRKLFLEISAFGGGVVLAYAVHPLAEKLGIGRIIRQIAGYP